MGSTVAPYQGASVTELPSKLFFRIGEVAGLVGVEPHVLRYWEREFRSVRPTKSAKGQRVYSRKDVESLIRVRDLLYRDRFTIAGAKQRLKRGTLELGPEGVLPFRFTHTPDAPTNGSAQPNDVASGSAPELRLLKPAPHLSPSESSRPFVGSSMNAIVRGKLVELRAEIESFLDELETDL